MRKLTEVQRRGTTNFDVGSVKKNDGVVSEATVTATVASTPAEVNRNSSAFKAHVPAAATEPGAAAPVSTEPVQLKPEQLDIAVKKKGVCPFIGTAMATGALPIRNSADKPLGSIADVVALGNTGGGDLGKVLALFANGNHALMVGASGKLDTEVPPGTFSLDLAGSQGSHPGHSGILNGNPLMLNSGRFDDQEWKRFESHSQGGYTSVEGFGAFIAENVLKDPSSKTPSLSTLLKQGADVVGLLAKTPAAAVETIANAFRKNDTHEAQRDALEATTKLLGEENITGASGEYALLFAFLINSPNTKWVDGKPQLAMSDLESMFVKKEFPAGWETWPKRAVDWVHYTGALSIAATKSWLHQRHEHANGVI